MPIGSEPVSCSGNLRDPNTFWGPWGVAFDVGRSAYVQSFLSNATTFVYLPGANLPNRIFRVDGPDSRAIAVDAAGYSYVASGQAGSVISVAAPGARGVPANLYSVAPLRQIPTDETPFHPWPSILSTDNAGHVTAAVAPVAPVAPVRTVAGPRTGLGSCSWVCEHIALAFSPLTGELYVAVSHGEQTRVNVYPANATGDTAPTRVISGPATGLAGQVVTGIAASRIDGSVYVMARPSQFDSSGTMLVFDRFASGNSAPRRRFTDAVTGLRDAQGIAVL